MYLQAKYVAYMLIDDYTVVHLAQPSIAHDMCIHDARMLYSIE